jgi:hypothetical protein
LMAVPDPHHWFKDSLKLLTYGTSLPILANG